MTSIEWTRGDDGTAGKTWNPVRGCSIVSPGCVNCYAMKQAHRFSGPGKAYHGLTKLTGQGPQWTGKVVCDEAKLLEPLSWRKPARVFVNSMSDLFHESVPDAFIDRVFAVMALASWNTFQILTKRADRMRVYLTSRTGVDGAATRDVYQSAYYVVEDNNAGQAVADRPWPLPNVWLGTSVENQQTADERIPLLLQTPAAIRFISAEPLVGPIRLEQILLAPGDRYGDGAVFTNALTGESWMRDGFEKDQPSTPRLDWVIVGGESGPGARPMHPDWPAIIRNQCRAAGVPFFFKQWGEWAPGECAEVPPTRTERTATLFNGQWSFGTLTPRQSEETREDDAPDLYRLGKKAAGRLLDGREWNEFPAEAP